MADPLVPSLPAAPPRAVPPPAMPGPVSPPSGQVPLAARQRQQYAPPRRPERQAGPGMPDARWAAFLPVPAVGPTIAAAGALGQMVLDPATRPPFVPGATAATPTPPMRRATPQDVAAAFHPEGAMRDALSRRGIAEGGPYGQHYIGRAQAIRDVYDFIDGLPPGESMPMEEVQAFIEGYLEAAGRDTYSTAEPGTAGNVVSQTFQSAIADPSAPIYAEMAEHIDAEGPWAMWRIAIEPIAQFRGYDQRHLQFLQRDFANRVSQYDKAAYQAKVAGTEPPTFQQFLAASGYRV